MVLFKTGHFVTVQQQLKKTFLKYFYALGILPSLVTFESFRVPNGTLAPKLGLHLTGMTGNLNLNLYFKIYFSAQRFVLFEGDGTAA